MAFNPFHTFRKNSKPILAVVTIFTVFLFVLSSGIGQGGDFFDWIGRQLGASSRRGEVLGSIDGTDYYARNLQELRMRRAAANMFLLESADKADQRTLASLTQEVASNSFKNPETARMLGMTMQLRQMVMTQPPNEQLINFYMQTVRQLESACARQMPRETPIMRR